MNLGEKLQANWDAANAAMTDAEARKRAQDHRLWLAENKKVLAAIEEIKAKIINAIENGDPIKEIKLPRYEGFETYKWKEEKMIGQFYLVDHPHYTAINSFFAWANENGLVGKFIPEHDGMGMESWFVATVEPAQKG